MALGEGVKCGVVDGEVEEMLGFGCVKYTRGMGRKRIVIFSNVETSPDDSAMHAPLKRQCSGRLSIESDKSALETLPQDILIRILCGVEHEDLKQLVRVSKSIKEAVSLSCHSEAMALRLQNPYQNPRIQDFDWPRGPKRGRRY
ncbi:F-box protein SKIP27-like isoform X2 [Punica granatum]|uniref:F-box protein SKIP27-like isoform X2 n=1 Tax=Punica granatum TaxID=22663 RepID=A0A6P8DPL9_PUNGR|nr:F-box protein SKIP27-like isoform X2 [Punica granatum]